MNAIGMNRFRDALKRMDTHHGEDSGDGPDDERDVDTAGVHEDSGRRHEDAGADDAAHDDGDAVHQAHFRLERDLVVLFRVVLHDCCCGKDLLRNVCARLASTGPRSSGRPRELRMQRINTWTIF